MPCPGSDSEEEEGSGENTEGASSSESDSEGEGGSPEQTEEQRGAALKAAIRDARRLLKDGPRNTAKNSFVEDEVRCPATCHA